MNRPAWGHEMTLTDLSDADIAPVHHPDFGCLGHEHMEAPEGPQNLAEVRGPVNVIKEALEAQAPHPEPEVSPARRPNFGCLEHEHLEAPEGGSPIGSGRFPPDFEKPPTMRR